MLLHPHLAHSANVSRAAHHTSPSKLWVPPAPVFQTTGKQHRQRQRCKTAGAAEAGSAVGTPFDVLSRWLSQNGGSVGSITAGDCQMGGVTVRGLVALQDLPANTPILSVPISSTLRDDRAPQAYPRAPWNANLAAQLLQERQQGSASVLWPYIATLPVSCCSPLLLQDHQLPEVQYSPAMDAIASYRRAVHAAYDSWRAVCAAEGQQQFTWQDWAWAVHMVQSRSIRLAITGCKVLIPGIDLLNHGGAAANGQLVLGKASWQLAGEPAVCFVTSQHIAAGQQVLWSYGTRGNDDYFVYHGFALPDNPDEDVQLFEGVGQLTGWALQRLPQLRPLAAAGWDQQQLVAAAEAAAARAAQEASAFCPSGAIQGTSSSVLLPLPSLSQQLRQPVSRLQQQAQQQWQQQLQRGGGAALCEAAVLSGMKYLKLQRRLASRRLHSPVWGTPDCPPTIPELVLRRDGCVDVRLPAVLAALLDQAAAAAAAGGSSSETGQEAGVRGEELAVLLQQLLQMRCQELLEAFATSIEQDDAWLQQQQQRQQQAGDSSEAEVLMAAVVQYRRAKKQVLQAQAASLH